MMKQQRFFPYYESESFQLLGLPYKEHLTMYIALPKEKFGLNLLMQNLTGRLFLKIIRSGMKNRDVVVSARNYRTIQL